MGILAIKLFIFNFYMTIYRHDFWLEDGPCTQEWSLPRLNMTNVLSGRAVEGTKLRPARKSMALLVPQSRFSFTDKSVSYVRKTLQLITIFRWVPFRVVTEDHRRQITLPAASSVETLQIVYVYCADQKSLFCWCFLKLICLPYLKVNKINKWI